MITIRNRGPVDPVHPHEKNSPFDANALEISAAGLGDFLILIQIGQEFVEGRSAGGGLLVLRPGQGNPKLIHLRLHGGRLRRMRILPSSPRSQKPSA